MAHMHRSQEAKLKGAGVGEAAQPGDSCPSLATRYSDSHSHANPRVGVVVEELKVLHCEVFRLDLVFWSHHLEGLQTSKYVKQAVVVRVSPMLQDVDNRPTVLRTLFSSDKA